MKRIKTILSRLLIIAIISLQLVPFMSITSYADQDVLGDDTYEVLFGIYEGNELLASPSTAEAYIGSKDYFTTWTNANVPLNPTDHFWEIMAMSSLDMNIDTGIDYANQDYDDMPAVNLSKYIMCMVADGVDPKTIRGSGSDVVTLLKSFQQSDGSYINTNNSTDYGGVYSQPFPIFALYICGESVDKVCIDYFDTLVGPRGDYGGGSMEYFGMLYTWDGDASTTGWALMGAKYGGHKLASEIESKAYMATCYASNSDATYLDLNNCAGYITWKVSTGASVTDEASQMAAYFDRTNKNFTYPGVYDEHYCTKECARAIAEAYTGKTFIEALRSKYLKTTQSVRKSNNVIESDNDPIKNAINTNLDDREKMRVKNTNAVAGDWKLSESGKWTLYIDGVQVKNRWVTAYNPAAGKYMAGWFYFDANGEMLVGWQKIKDADGIERWYYLNPIPGPWYGACYKDTVTPDGYVVDSKGAWMDPSIVSSEEIAKITEKASSEDGTSSGTKSSETSSEESSNTNKISVSVSVSGNVVSGSEEVTLKKNASAYDALKALAKKMGWSVSGSSSYVKGIGGEMEKSAGAKSGWTYSVNGDTPKKSAGSYKLKDGDSVDWTFVDGPDY